MNTPVKRSPPRLLQVVRAEYTSSHLRKITLGGSELAGFPRECFAAHIKVFIPLYHQNKPVLPTLGPNGVVWPPADQKPIVRTYSVRSYRADEQELDVEFVMHDQHDELNSCPASRWAKKAKPGDYLGIAGPGGPDPLLAPAAWHILAGDLSASPAIAALLENLPGDAEGHAFIEYDEPGSRFSIKHPKNFQLNWVERKRYNDVLLSEVQKLSPPEQAETISAFIAGESSSVVRIRNYLKARYRLNKRSLYAVPYWRRGQDEETYHQERHRIMDEVY